MYDQVMVEVCNWCIRFLYKASDYLGMSYEEINVWLFIIIQPGLILYFYLSSSKWKKIFKIENQFVKLKSHKINCLNKCKANHSFCTIIK